MNRKILTTGTSPENNAFVINWRDSITAFGNASSKGIVILPVKEDDFISGIKKKNNESIIPSLFGNANPTKPEIKVAYDQYVENLQNNNKNYYKEYFLSMGYQALEPNNNLNIYKFVVENIKQQQKIGLYNFEDAHTEQLINDINLTLPAFIVTFTERGLGLLTQLEQHADNINQNEKASQLNKTLVWVAGISLFFSSISLYLSYKLITPTQKAATATESLAKDSKETLRILKSKQVKNVQLPIEQFILSPKSEKKIDNNLYIYAGRTETNK